MIYFKIKVSKVIFRIDIYIYITDLKSVLTRNEQNWNSLKLLFLEILDETSFAIDIKLVTGKL